MKQGILAGVIVYELVTILAVGLWIARLQKRRAGEQDSFTHAGHGLPMPAVAFTLALTVLGAVHVFGVFEMTWGLGASVIWFAFAHVILLCGVCLATGRWVRRLRIGTVPQLLETAYGLETRLLVTCVMIGAVFGILTLESQGLGILFYAMTGWPIEIGAVVGGALGIFYVILAGMREVSYLNIINAVVMYIALVLSVIFLGFALPGDGYASVAEAHRAAGNAHLLNPLGDVSVVLVFGLPIIISIAVSQSTNQMLLQTAMSAKSEATLARSMWIAAPVNGMFAVFAVILALAAMTVPEFAERGPKVATTDMLVELLPPWLAAMLLAAFTGVILSTFAMTALVSSTLFATDIYKRLYHPAASERQVTRVTRICIVVFGILSMFAAMFMPPILGGVAWLLAWLTPVFWVVVFALFWKRNQGVAMVALLASWALNSAWTFTDLPSAFGVQGVDNAYVTFTTGLVVMVGGLLLFGGKPGLMRQVREGAAPPGAAAAAN